MAVPVMVPDSLAGKIVYAVIALALVVIAVRHFMKTGRF